MKYKCLIFDHDDTAVNSTRSIHYPCFLEFIKTYGFGFHFTLEEFIRYNFDPGVFRFYKEICGMTDDEVQLEYGFWSAYVSKHCSEAFPGIKEIMEEHKAAGGITAVVSHSLADNIRKDYIYNSLPMPDEIFGFEQPKEELKPSPVPVRKIIEKYSLSPSDVLVIDDLKPGYDMARAAGVSFAAAAWCFDIPSNSEFMRQNADYFCRSVKELAAILK